MVPILSLRFLTIILDSIQLDHKENAYISGIKPLQHSLQYFCAVTHLFQL